MTITPAIYPWRRRLVPRDQLFRAGGQALPGGRTLGGFLVESPEPGGVSSLSLTLVLSHDAETNRDAAWTASRIQNGAVMRIPLCGSVQLVPATSLGVSSAAQLPWSNGQSWSNGQNWDWNPSVPVNAASSKGAAEVTADFSSFGEVLEIGHVIGFREGQYDFAHEVMDVTYVNGDIATVGISPPLRRAVAANDDLYLRPKTMMTCVNAAAAAKTLRNRRFMVFETLEFVEALL